MARNILVVEDDRNISDLIRMYLEKEGFEVRSAYDGGKAVSDSGTSSPCRIRAESCSKESVMSSPVFCVDKLPYYYRHGEEDCQTGRLIFWLWRDTLSE